MSISSRAGLAVFLAVASLIVISAFGHRRLECEACMDYGGQSVCRTVAGEERRETERGARDNACATLARGRIEHLRCVSSKPSRLECVQR